MLYSIYALTNSAIMISICIHTAANAIFPWNTPSLSALICSGVIAISTGIINGIKYLP